MVIQKRYFILALVLMLVLGAGLFWFFVGGALVQKEVEEIIPAGETLKHGPFIPIDNLHKGSGTAKIIRVQDQHYLVLENFQVTNGPDLYVYLSQNQEVITEEDLGKFEEISPLKGNIGNQMYLLTSEQAENSGSVVIWCKRFSVLFSSAMLR